jgi:hypothetical protein
MCCHSAAHHSNPLLAGIRWSYFSNKYHLLLLHAMFLRPIKVKLQKCNQHNDEPTELTVGEERSNVSITREGGAFQPTMIHARAALVGFMQCWAALVVTSRSCNSNKYFNLPHSLPMLRLLNWAKADDILRLTYSLVARAQDTRQPGIRRSDWC